MSMLIDAYRFGGGGGGGVWVPSASFTPGGTSAGWNGYTLRVRIPSSAISQYGSKCRLTLSSSGLVIAGAYFQEAGTTVDFASTPAQVMFGGVGTYSGAGTTTDEILVPISPGKSYVASFYFNGATSIDTNTSVTTWLQAYKSGSDAASITASGYSSSAQASLVTLLEVFQ
ncbi:MAG: hypothetical protein HZT39_09895 [Pseudoxanthomonas sp.]|nr:MAG: hypothetical protein HZT39_09895 [Pseudoxanthomonas sp.]